MTHFLITFYGHFIISSVFVSARASALVHKNRILREKKARTKTELSKYVHRDCGGRIYRFIARCWWPHWLLDTARMWIKREKNIMWMSVWIYERTNTSILMEEYGSRAIYFAWAARKLFRWAATACRTHTSIVLYEHSNSGAQYSCWRFKY